MLGERQCQDKSADHEEKLHANAAGSDDRRQEIPRGGDSAAGLGIHIRRAQAIFELELPKVVKEHHARDGNKSESINFGNKSAGSRDARQLRKPGPLLDRDFQTRLLGNTDALVLRES